MTRPSIRHRAGVLLGALFWAALLPLSPDEALARSDNDPPVFGGETGQFILYEPIKAAPLTPFLHGATNETLDLTQFRGKVVLLNFWATWCAPCIREMPSLDRLQAEMGGADFTVLALSIDRAGAGVAERFYRTLGVKHLELYLDSDEAAYRAFEAYGLPTSYVIDRAGRAMGYLPGAADWSSKEAGALLGYYVARNGG